MPLHLESSPLRSITTSSLDDALERIMARAGLEGVTAHTLRHSFASTAGDLGYSDSTIGAMLGHAGSTITSRYVHHLDAVLIAAADRAAGKIAKDLSSLSKSRHLNPTLTF